MKPGTKIDMRGADGIWRPGTFIGFCTNGDYACEHAFGLIVRLYPDQVRAPAPPPLIERLKMAYEAAVRGR